MNRLELAASLTVLGLLASVTGCKAHVGSSCTLNTDCSLQGTLVCDTSQPNGYCTLFNCVPDTCQNEAACVAIGPQVPGCGYNDYNSPARTALTTCLQQCQRPSDCRTSEGYVCTDPRGPPWNAVIVDDDQAQLVCILAPDYYDGGPDGALASFRPDADVCQATAPSPAPAIEAGVVLEPLGDDGGGDAGAGGE
jgi:hypothetical protein